MGDGPVGGGARRQTTRGAARRVALVVAVSALFLTGCPPQPDTEPPTVPQNVTAEPSVEPIVVSVGWDASTDNRGVTGYDVYRNGVVVASVTGTSFEDAEVDYGTEYNYSVRANDAAGNRSDLSDPATVSIADPDPDECPAP